MLWQYFVPKLIVYSTTYLTKRKINTSVYHFLNKKRYVKYIFASTICYPINVLHNIFCHWEIRISELSWLPFLSENPSEFLLLFLKNFLIFMFFFCIWVNSFWTTVFVTFYSDSGKIIFHLLMLKSALNFEFS